MTGLPAPAVIGGWQWAAPQIRWQVWLVAVGVLLLLLLIIVPWARHLWRRLTSDVKSIRPAVAAAAGTVDGQLTALADESDPVRRAACTQVYREVGRDQA